MKKLVAFALGIAMLLACVSAVAEGSVFVRFQPYTNVDLSAFEKAGFTTSYDEFAFNAELYPPVSKIEVSDGGSYFKDTYTIKLDVKIVYSAGEALVVPRMIFTRKGNMTYYDNRMSDVYIKNGENRYRVNVSGCSRSTDSKNSSATDSTVEPIRLRGSIMLADLATNPMEIKVSFNNLGTITLKDADKAAIKAFYDACKEAGVFEQEALFEYTDDYSILTLFNAGSTGTEDASGELEPAPQEE